MAVAMAVVVATAATVVAVADAADATATGVIVAGTATVGKNLAERGSIMLPLSLFARLLPCYPCFTSSPI